MARKLREAAKGDTGVVRLWADVTDPDLEGGGSGVPDFDERPPFRPPAIDIGGGPGNGPINAPAPVEIPPQLVQSMGWDHGKIGQRPIRTFGGNTTRTGFLDYIIETPFNDGDVITATLTWNRTVTVNTPNFNPNNPRVAELNTLELENLNLLILPSFLAGEIAEDDDAVAASTSTWDNVEHVFWRIDRPGSYMIRVQWVSNLYDFFENQPNGDVEFGLAWRHDSFGFSFFNSGRTVTPAMRLSMMLSGFNTTTTQGGYDPMGDLNSDGRIDGLDLAILLSTWNRK
jgi:hypothetical protein